MIVPDKKSSFQRGVLILVVILGLIEAGLLLYKSRNVRPRASRNHEQTANLTPVANQWLGKWIGPEGTFLELSRQGDKYSVMIQSLDGPSTYMGRPTARGLEFERNGKTETIHAGNGEDTGMKWLLDKKDCLIIRAGEGFCRN